MVAIAARADIRPPAVTLLVAAAAMAVYATANGSDWFVYDRQRILDGELWRLVTGHLVHFSWQHLAYNLVVFTLAGAWLEWRLGARYVWLPALTALAGGLYFLAFVPDMARYGGLSGLASANVVCLSLVEYQRDRKTRPFWAAMLLLVAAKSAYELLFNDTVFVSTANTLFDVVPSVHLLGAVVALACFAAMKPGNRKKAGS